MGITHVVRGMDLFSATHVHRLLQALLGLPTPLYRHHDLLAGMDGKRLAKRNGGQTLADLRAAGADPERLITDLRRNVFPVGISIANARSEEHTSELQSLMRISYAVFCLKQS